MRIIPLLIFFLFAAICSHAGRIVGTVTDSSGTILSYSTIEIVGKNISTTANSEGRYYLNLAPGTYLLICQHVGYRKQEKLVEVGEGTVTVNFQLARQELTLEEVIVQKGEDPAYEIIRNAIKKRTQHRDELKKFTVEVYTKGHLKLRDHPEKIMGKKVDFEDGDTSKKRMLYLSETIARFSVDPPDNEKIEVLATKVSGQSNGFGLSAPQIISFYDNNLMIGENLNPRGFISPVSDNALNYYRYKYEGEFFDEGVLVNRIKLEPKRKYEPLFSGYINIVEDEWRIHSLQLQLTKESQMELMDTLTIEQLYVPLEQVWVMKSQVIYPAIKLFGFDVHGNFANVYSGYNLNPVFPKKFFDNTILKYSDSSTKKSDQFWSSSRPVVLQDEEILDYRQKDSLEQVRKQPAYLDSLDRLNNKITIGGILLTGESFNKRKSRSSVFYPSLFETVNFNTVEGVVVDFAPTFSKRLDTTASGRRSYSITPNIRYGFSNNHLNLNLTARYTYGKKYMQSFLLSGGTDVFQFNNENPIRPRNNSISTLFFKRNHMKIYEAVYGTIGYSQGIGDGFTWVLTLNYQDRKPLENTTDFTWSKKDERIFTPNYPEELMTENFKRHQALITSLTLRWQPGTKYIELPERKINIGSEYPVMSLTLAKAPKKLLGNDVDYSKWQFIISDDINMRLVGKFSYRLEWGGFFDKDSVQVPDYVHVNGNQLIVASNFLNSFRLAPYYEYSHTEPLYTEIHAEHHFNGFLTNKIPLFRKLNWHLVGGGGVFLIDKNNYYGELYAGLENIFKMLRIDLIYGYEQGKKVRTGVRFGLNGALNRR